jgi:hypothetical protein
MSVDGIRRHLDRLMASTDYARFESLSSTLDRAGAEARQRAERGEPAPFLLGRRRQRPRAGLTGKPGARLPTWTPAKSFSWLGGLTNFARPTP